jgi:hypothetical protein
VRELERLLCGPCAPAPSALCQQLRALVHGGGAKVSLPRQALHGTNYGGTAHKYLDSNRIDRGYENLNPHNSFKM